ncbi:SDR family oxidoreductase [uncultured Jannaschia sp.]|uniref:SDR family NAD(P)-dependent oxidoreductase n=1 Tax=uncultured Jannaschia sp. TaxID=293347 RepID=UPI0026285244|nr:SDR family oxidoreductase [uncultured Jannaschia sp.]
MPFHDQTILLTGATGTIGVEIARCLAADGARVLLHYVSNADAAERLATEIGGGARALRADLTDPVAATALWEDAVSLAGRIDGLVNNAAIRSELTIDADLDAWHAYWAREMQVNFQAAADLTRAAIRHFLETGGGRIVNMGSRSGQRGYTADAMAYGCGKAALMNLTKTVARNFGTENIHCVAISPGWVRSPMAEAYIAENGEAAALGEIPIRALAEPAEVARAVAFALDRRNVSLTGAVIDINGASYLR